MRKNRLAIFAGILAWVLMIATPVMAETPRPEPGTLLAEPVITVTLNGKDVLFDTPPVNVNDRVLVPFRAIGEAMGADVDWDAKNRKVLLSLGDRYVQFTINSVQMQYGENLSSSFYSRQTYTLDAPAQIISDRTLVPVRAISEGLGVKVDWDIDTSTVVLTSAAPSGEIQNRSDLISALAANIRDMKKDFTLSVKNYSQSEFGINLFDYFNCITSYGTSPNIGSIHSTIDYHIDYTMSYLVSAAIRGNDPSALDKHELAVYDAAKEAIANVIAPEMSDYEKEKAIHDYIIETASYDAVTSPTAPSTSPYASTPYGVLIDHRALYNGYSDTFLMFMDILGIECETITGRVDGVGHSWNRIKLDGDYYLADLSLDEPSPDSADQVLYDYFNVTDSIMNKNHRPDKHDSIVCDATAYNYFYYSGLTVSDQAEFEQAVAEAVRRQSASLSVLCVGIVPEDLDLTKVFTYHPSAFGHSVNNICGILHIEF